MGRLGLLANTAIGWRGLDRWQDASLPLFVLIFWIAGALNCDEFGDCGASEAVIDQNGDPSDVAATGDNVVFEMVPYAGQTRLSLTEH